MRRIDQITLKQLRALNAVVHEHTILAAADRLNLTGPAVHNQLKSLEDTIGCTLIARSGPTKNTPTPQGQALLNAYEETQASLERALRQIRALDAGRQGSVVFGVVSTAKYFAPRIVAQLRDHLPDVEINLKVGNRKETVAALVRGEFDLCIMGRPPRQPLTDATPLASHPHIIIAAADHPLAKSAQVTRADLMKEVWVMREEGSGTRILTTRFLDDIGQGQEVEMVEMTSNETIKQAVKNGLGVALISAHTVAEELSFGRLVSLPLPGLPIVRQWYVLTHADKVLTPAAETVRDWIIAHVDDILPRLDV